MGFILPQEHFPIPRVIEFGIAAEKAGFDAIWTSDHFHPWQDNQGYAGQAWVTLAALGQRTRRVLLGTGVTCPTYRYRPAIVAQAFASLGVLYPGRIFLGIGAGEAVNEVPTGGGWGDDRERSGRLAEAAALIRRLWMGEWVTVQGRYYQIENARLYDLPPQPIPLYIAGAGRHAAELAGRYGDGLITGSKDAQPKGGNSWRRFTPERVRSARIRPRWQWSSSTGWLWVMRQKRNASRRSGSSRLGPGRSSSTTQTPRAMQRDAARQVPLAEVVARWVVSEDPEVHLEAIRRLTEAGATHIFIHSPQDDQQRVIEFYCEQVLPRVRHGRALR